MTHSLSKSHERWWWYHHSGHIDACNDGPWDEGPPVIGRQQDQRNVIPTETPDKATTNNPSIFIERSPYSTYDSHIVATVDPDGYQARHSQMMILCSPRPRPLHKTSSSVTTPKGVVDVSLLPIQLRVCCVRCKERCRDWVIRNRTDGQTKHTMPN